MKTLRGSGPFNPFTGDFLETVSVVIPVYNGSPHIRHCITVLEAQTHKDLDIIFVVDAKTTDDTVDQIRAISPDDRFRFVMQHDDQRMGGARNIGLDAARGEYIWFLDVDDTPYPTLVEEMVRILKDTGAEVATFNSIYSKNRDLPEKVYGRYRTVVMSGMEAVYHVGCGRLSVCPWSKIFRTDFLRSNAIRFIPGYCEDLDQTVRAFLASDRVAYFNKPLYVYYQHSASLCGGSNDDAIATRDVELAGDLGEAVREKHPECYDLYCSYMARHVIRSLTRASRDKALELSEHPNVRELVSHKQPDFNAEVVIFRFSPKLYYALGSRARARKFSMDTDVLFDSDFS